MLEAEICLNQEVITWGDGIDIHENLLPIEMRGQTVVQASSRPSVFLATVTDEDLPTHFSRPPSATENLQSSGKDPILDGETSDGEPQLLSRRSPTFLPHPCLKSRRFVRDSRFRAAP
jgi:hypothetical protein